MTVDEVVDLFLLALQLFELFLYVFLYGIFLLFFCLLLIFLGAVFLERQINDFVPYLQYRFFAEFQKLKFEGKSGGGRQGMEKGVYFSTFG